MCKGIATAPIEARVMARIIEGWPLSTRMLTYNGFGFALEQRRLTLRAEIRWLPRIDVALSTIIAARSVSRAPSKFF
jgi:hypothetical protein